MAYEKSTDDKRRGQSNDRWRNLNDMKKDPKRGRREDRKWKQQARQFEGAQY